MPKGLYVLIVGPTAVGKDTAVRILRERFPDAAKPVNATTRAPREGEKDGVHYHFLSPEEFRRRIDAGDFLEWAEYGTGKRYGSLRSAIEDQLERHRLVLNIVDVQGARATREKMPETLTVFLMPESAGQLQKRLLDRGMGWKERNERLRTAREEVTAAGEFDHIVVNREGRIEEVVSEIVDLIEARIA